MPETDHPMPPDCGGRFAIQSFLGAGGMGAVYAVYDHRRHSQVALKVMQRVTGTWIYRFKNEFRSLAGIVHPNLVTLHELIQWEDQWLFTMELVPGVDFSQAAGRAGTLPATTPVGRSGPPVSAEELPTVAERSKPRERRPVFSDVYRVSDALRQLCDGLDFLHRLGIVHGDVKPANALITPNGRVVILDFGISRSWREDEGAEALPVLGTPGYLAPECRKGSRANPASDMYAVGVVLFELLAGREPTAVADATTALRESRGDVPATDTALLRRETMEALCLRLLARDPMGRPAAAEVRDALVSEGARATRETAVRLAPAVDRGPFVARVAELEVVRNALLDKRPEAPRVVIVSGESGVGKTELMRRVLDDELPSSCVVLEGTCYEREQVPYRAMDRVVDSLSSRLLRVPDEAIRALAWEDVAAASRMFPVLRRVPEIERLWREAPREQRTPRRQQRAAAAMLARLLTLVAERRRVVLYVDDLHWGDDESGALLRDLLLAADDLDLRVVGCQRPPVGEGLLARLLEGDPALLHQEIQIRSLAEDESEALVRALLGPEAAPAHVARVAAESRGNPFLIRELVEFGAGVELGDLALRSAVARHVALLSEQARSVLEVLAVAGRSLDIGLVREATGIGQTFDAAVILLRSQHLIKAADLRGERIEPYHDRIREVILQELGAEAQAARHRDIARALEERGDADPAILGFHLEGAGARERAVDLRLEAGRVAEASLAPLNAAGHYGKVAELAATDDPRHLLGLRGQARSLSAAGRAAAAGPIYMRLAEAAPPAEALELRRTAAEAWVYAGEFEKARSALRTVFDAAGIREPRTPVGVLWGIGRHRLWLRRRANRYAPVDEADVAPDRLLRIDAYETATALSSSVDLLRVYLAHSAHVRESLAVGEPRRVARALIQEVVVGGIGGERSSRQGLELLRIASEALEGGDFPEERSLVRFAAGVHALLNGRYAHVVKALGELAHAPDLRRVGQQLRMARSVLGYSRWWLGQWRTLGEEYRGWLLDAEERGDQLSGCVFRLEQGGQWASLLDDQPERASEQVARALASPVGSELSFEHLSAKQTRAWVALYLGRADEAERVLSVRGAEKTYLRVQRSRVEIAVLHAFAALARGGDGLRSGRRWLRRIENEGLTWPQPVARLIAASLAFQEGRPDEAVARLEVAVSECERFGYEAFAAAAAWRLGAIQAGAEGAARRQAAEAWLVAQGAVRPDRVVRTLAPGFGA